MRYRQLLLLLVGVSVMVGCQLSAPEANSPASEKNTAATVKLRLIETSDLHMHLLDYNYLADKPDATIGLVKAATLIHQARAGSDNNILIDNGDLLQGSAMGDYVQQHDPQLHQRHPAYTLMNALHYDVGNIGNHDFNYGLDFLKAAVAGADFPYINANVFTLDPQGKAAAPLFKPYVLLQRQVVDSAGQEHALTIGVIGFAPPQIMQWDRTRLQGKVVAKDMVTMAKHYVPQMKQQGADIIVAVPHSGLNVNAPAAMAENAVYELAAIDGIDAILFGHSHGEFPGGKPYDGLQQQEIDNKAGTILGKPAVMPGFWGNHIGIIDLTLEPASSWQVVASQAQLRSSKDVNTDQKLAHLIDTVHQQTRAWVNRPIAKLGTTLTSYFSRVHDDASLQLINDAQRWYGRKITQGTEFDGLPILAAASPFRSGFQGRDDFTNIAAGQLAFRNIADLYVFPNTVQVIKLNGDQVREWLEMSAGQFNQITTTNGQQPLFNPHYVSFNFDVIDGVNYRIDISQPARYHPDGSLADAKAHRIVDLTYQGHALTRQQTFLLVTNNYRASGGGHFPGLTPDMVVIKAPDMTRTALQQYLAYLQQKQGSVQVKADDNWQLIGLAKGSSVPFVSSNSQQAKQQARDAGNITFDDDLKDRLGFGRYSLKF